MSAPIAYLISEYPSITHTFVRREVMALRDAGFDVRCISVRQPAADAPLGPADARERSGTTYVLPLRAFTTPVTLARAFVRHPIRYLTTLWASLTHRRPGLRGLVWSFAYFVEGMVVARELERSGARRLHNHFANAAANAGRLAARYRGIPWSMTLHGNADFEGPMRHLLGAKIATCDLVACVSEDGRRRAQETVAPTHWHKLFVAHCAIDPAELPSHKPSRVRGRVLSVGRLSPEKGQRGLLEAFAQLDETAHLRLVGDGPERGALERRARELEIAERVEFVGAQPLDRVLDEMLQCEVFALSSLIEGIPVVLMEAMALSTCVIAPRITGIPELVEHGVSGLLFTAADWNELAAHLRRALGDAALRERFGAAGLERVEAEFVIRRAIEPLRERFGDA